VEVAKISLYPRVSPDDELLMRRMESQEFNGAVGAHHRVQNIHGLRVQGLSFRTKGCWVTDLGSRV
jgi:hypothetical protein